MEKTVYESNVPRVYTLYRVSTIGQVEKDDIPMQKQVCRDFAKKQGWVVVKEFSEKGISGYKVSAKDRDAIQEIQHDAALGKFDILLVFMFDRLGRRDDETPFIVEWFVKNGVEVWSAMEGQQRFDNHVDKLMNYIRYWQVYQNIEFIDYYNPDYVLILSGDHIYKMDYENMLEYHKSMNADVTLATYQVPWEEASRFGVVITNDDGIISEFEEKPENPRSNKASMGIYIFNWKILREALVTMKDQPGCDFGKHIIPYCHENGNKICAYDFKGYWKDVGTLGSYWEANMELVDIVPEFNLYEEFWNV